ncbi:hypothetical protein [Salinibaculum salinum]|uniref:hypothetical protein n=1 Tax=Salinibaculum salinum TaxID=3131996 RepID=UPI0030EF0C58
MYRRAVLRTMGAGVVAATSGCVANGRVAVDLSESVTVEPTEGWWTELPDVDGDGALSFTVRADQLFDVYYFQREDSLTHYKNYLYKDDESEMPGGHDEISQAAIPNDDESKYEVNVPEDGGRRSIDTEGSHYFVVDHSNYGMGARVEASQDRLNAFVDLKLYENTSII